MRSNAWKVRALCAAVVCVSLVSAASADTFGTGTNQFNIDFVTISGDAGDLGSWPGGSGYTFTGVNRDDYRIGAYEVTNDQWNKFKAAYGTVTGTPSRAYDDDPSWTGTNVPTNEVSWYEAAQFVNWLNTSEGHQAAYKFTGTQGTSGYALATWDAGDADGTNLYRHKDAFYYLPTDDEWVKAGYWNGTSLQTWATPDDTQPVEDIEANYAWESGAQPWDVGSGSEELNGTYDIMGNVWEWMESPRDSGDYGTGSDRGLRGGSYNDYGISLASSNRGYINPIGEGNDIGFRVASEVPEPASLSLLAIGGLALFRRRRRSAAAVVLLLAGVAVVFAPVGNASADTFVYRTDPPEYRMGWGSMVVDREWGCEVELAGAERHVTELMLVADPPNGGTMDVAGRIYANDGQGGEPGSLLWDSGWRCVSFADGDPLPLTFEAPRVLVPNRITAVLAIENISNASYGGMERTDNITVGTVHTRWSRLPGSDWVQGLEDGTSVQMHVLAIPEPATMALLGLGGLALIARRRRNAAAVVLLLAGVAVVFAPVSTASAAQIFWTDNDNGTIHSADLDGSNAELLHSAGTNLVGLAVDPVGGKLYWVENALRRIGRADLDGSNPEHLRYCSGGVDYIDLDLTSGKMYWSGWGIRRADFDGSNFETVLTKDQAWSLGLAVDPKNGLLFWQTTTGVHRAALNGDNPQRVTSSEAYSLCVDPDAERIYVADWEGSRIYAVNYDGTAEQEVVTADVYRPRDVALWDGKLYWTDDHVTNRICRSNLDGTNFEVVMDLGEYKGPTGIVVIPEPATMALLALGGLALLRRRRTGTAASLLLLVGLGMALLPAGSASAVDIETVPVGNPGNPDVNYGDGWGGVDYEYNIGKYEVTAGQYTEFLNAVAATDPYGLYDTAMWGNDFGCKIQRSGLEGSYTYSVAADRGNRPVNFVSWADTARFCNWLTNGQPATGVCDVNTTEDGSYGVHGGTTEAMLLSVTRKPEALYAIPTVDEWIKAGYYDPNMSGGADYWDYPTGTNATPSNDLLGPDPGNNANFYQFGYTVGNPYWTTEVGEFENSASPFGTFDQGGNVWEWTEKIARNYGTNYRRLLGGGFTVSGTYLHAANPDGFGQHLYQSATIGLRVVQVPEPTTMGLLAIGGLAMLTRRRNA